MAFRYTSVLEQLKELLINTSPSLRKDYKEAAEVVYALLSGQDIEIKFRKYGAFHHARWMAIILYYGKMLLFSRQLNYLTEFVGKFHRFMQLVAIFYIVS